MLQVNNHQGGILADDTSTRASRNLPIAFPKRVIGAYGVAYDTGNGASRGYSFWIEPKGLTKFSAGFENDDKYNSNAHYSYMLIGC